jgi:elongation factor G
VGVKEFMDLLAKLAPSPAEGNAKPFIKGEGDDAQPLTFEPDPDKPLIGHVFKLTIDPFVGKLGVFRIHQGKITKDSSLHVADERKSFRIAHLLKLQGKDHDEIDEAIPGDICAAAKIEEINFDAVIHDGANPDVRFETVPFPSPMHGLAIEAKSRGDETKISRALAAIDAEDPCFTIERNPATNETVIRGLGDLHMRVVLEKMKQRFNVEVETKPPKIAYRETIQGKSEGHHRHKKQTGGAGQFGEVYLRVEPNEPGAGFEFINDIFGGAIPQQFLPAVEKGVQMVMNDGCIAGYPMQDIKVSVYDGKYHPVDSKEVAFVTAGKRAFIDAVHKAKPSILEPIVELEITVPEANMGDIAGDLSQKRGRIQGTESVPGGMTLIKAQAPLAELGNYQSQLKSVTGGQGSYTMEFSHYEPVPGNVQQQIVAQYKPREEED